MLTMAMTMNDNDDNGDDDDGDGDGDSRREKRLLLHGSRAEATVLKSNQNVHRCCRCQGGFKKGD